MYQLLHIWLYPVHSTWPLLQVQYSLCLLLLLLLLMLLLLLLLVLLQLPDPCPQLLNVLLPLGQ
jgi:hypothetical protein